MGDGGKPCQRSRLKIYDTKVPLCTCTKSMISKTVVSVDVGSFFTRRNLRMDRGHISGAFCDELSKNIPSDNAIGWILP